MFMRPLKTSTKTWWNYVSQHIFISTDIWKTIINHCTKLTSKHCTKIIINTSTYSYQTLHKNELLPSTSISRSTPHRSFSRWSTSWSLIYNGVWSHHQSFEVGFAQSKRVFNDAPPLVGNVTVGPSLTTETHCRSVLGVGMNWKPWTS